MSRFKLLLKKSIFLLLLTFIIVSLSGCGKLLGDLLNQIRPDYVTINLANAKLLSESINNEQICTYQIDANITNNYTSDLRDLSIKLNINSSATINDQGEKSSLSKNLSIGESVDYRWIVEIPKSNEDQTIEYSVSASSSEIKTVQAYATAYVRGRNKKDNRLDFNTDTWKFKNFSTKGDLGAFWGGDGIKGDRLPLTQDDYNALLAGLDNSSIEYLNQVIQEGTEGLCYGFAATSILVKMGVLNVDDISEETSQLSLHELSFDDLSVKSALSYYWLTQGFPSIMEERAQFREKNTEEQLRTIKEKAQAVEEGDSPFIFSIAYYNGEEDQNGHAMVGYSFENGKFSKNNTTYDSRVLIYDSNYPKWTEDSCLYFNEGTDDWYIPNYKKHNVITRALSDVNIMNEKNIEDNRKTAYSYLTTKDNGQISIYNDDNTLLSKIHGLDASGGGCISMPVDDGKGASFVIAIPKSDSIESYIIESDNGKDLDLKITYDNYYMSAKAGKEGAVKFDSNGVVGIDGNASDFEIQLTANEGYYSTDWHTIQIDGKNGKNPQIAIDDKGYLISGDELKKLKVYAKNGETAEELNIKSVDGTVLLTQEGDNLCAKIDSDSDGTYETTIEKGKDTELVSPISNSSSFNWWILAIILGAIIIIAGIVALCIMLFGGKKSSTKVKKNKNNGNSDDEWWK